MSRAMLLAATLLAATTSPLRAQVEADAGGAKFQGSGGLSMGTLAGEWLTASLRWSRLEHHGFGFDVALTTAPRLLVRGAVLLMPSLGPAIFVPLTEGALLVKAGVAPAVFVSGRGVVVGWVGPYYGAGLIVAKRGSSGVRLDWTQHFVRAGQSVHMVELGFAKSFR